MTVDHTEKSFENAIEDNLLTSGGYCQGGPQAFDAKLGLSPPLIVGF